MTLEAAIRDRLIVRFTYDGHHRVVQPATIGHHVSTGNLLLRGYQVAGSSSSGAPPKWDLFKISKIRDLTLSSDRFESDPPGYRRGDRHFRTIIAQL